MDVLVGLALDPSAKNAAARKYERVNPTRVDDGQLQIATEWRGYDGLPLHGDRIFSSRRSALIPVNDLERRPFGTPRERERVVMPEKRTDRRLFEQVFRMLD